jgi:hypothetical protein
MGTMTNWPLTLYISIYSYLPSQVKVVVAQVSLITQDTDEQVISVFKIFINDGYLPDTKLHDIAMLQVLKSMTN